MNARKLGALALVAGATGAVIAPLGAGAAARPAIKKAVACLPVTDTVTGEVTGQYCVSDEAVGFSLLGKILGWF